MLGNLSGTNWRSWATRWQHHKKSNQYDGMGRKAQGRAWICAALSVPVPVTDCGVRRLYKKYTKLVRINKYL